MVRGVMCKVSPARVFALLLSSCFTGRLCAQSCLAAAPILVGSEWEQYVRVAQVAGAVALQPWMVRELDPRQWSKLFPRDTSLPWSDVTPGAERSFCGKHVRAFVLAPNGQLIYNSSFPITYNDGAVWAGRGVTVVANGGGSVSAGPFTLTVAPIFFSTENERFTLAANGLTGDGRFADWLSPGRVDLPQRFGDRAYSQIDPGQSSARIDLFNIALGVSTANQFFGPATDHPIILGNNAAGFPHLFVGSSTPMRLWRLGSMHGRVFWGKLSESRFSPLASSGYSRLGSGIVGVFQPSGIPGLELGGTRFFHLLQTRFTLNKTELLRPLGAHETGTPQDQVSVADNQLGSLFARLVLPNDGVEVYGEFGHEDYNRDLREFFFFLDHDSAYLLGLRKLWRGDGTITSVRAEVLNSRVTHIALSSNQALWYEHTAVLQGHTNGGQALGSAAGHGGGGSVLAVERYGRRGRWRVEWQRMEFGQARTPSEPPSDPFRGDIAHMLGASVLRFGPRADVDIGVTGVYEFNRYLERDAVGLRTSVSISPSSRRPQ
jgi:hypothetical protein